MKRFMKMAAFSALTVCVAISCGLQEIGGEVLDENQGGIWGGPIEDNDGAGGIRQICYLTALDYQKGYEWRSDPARGTVR